jgi:hypothetical protein
VTEEQAARLQRGLEYLLLAGADVAISEYSGDDADRPVTSSVEGVVLLRAGHMLCVVAPE